MSTNPVMRDLSLNMVLARNSRRMLPGILAAIFAGAMAVSVVLTAILLDSFLIRYDRGSVTTMLPGFVYALVLILKAGLVEAAVLGVFAFVTMAVRRREAEYAGENHLPVWTIAAVLMPAMAPLIGTLVILATQMVIDKPAADTLGYFTRISRTGVLALMGILLASIAAAIVSLVRRERPSGLSTIPIVTGSLLLTLFVYWEFYKLGFDQDRWNDI